MKFAGFSTGKVIAAAVVLAWVVLLGIFVWRNYENKAASAQVSMASDASGHLEEEWYSILFKGKKAGWVHNSYSELPDGRRMVSDTFLKILALGEVQEMRMNLDAEMDSKLYLRRFSMRLSSQLQNMSIEGEVSGRQLTFRIRSPAESEPVEQKITLNEPPALMDMVGQYALQKGLKVGTKFSIPVFDPITQNNAKADAEVVREEKVKVGSKVVDTFVVRVTYLGMEMTNWVDATGRMVKSDSPMGLSTVLTNKEDALSLDDAGKVDIVAASAVTVDKYIPDSRQLTYLKVRLLGVEFFEGLALNGDHRVFKDGVLEVKTPVIGGGYELPDNDPSRKAERSPEPLIQSNDPAIKAAAGEAVGNVTGSVEAARRINQWVYSKLQKAGTFTVPSAVEVLKSRRGDCNEHTQLYVAMARSVGLPARPAVGVVYLSSAFYYHAWPEVWLGADSGWVPIDPTFGQFPADATHLRMVAGSLEKQAEIVRFVGKLSIEVIEYK